MENERNHRCYLCDVLLNEHNWSYEHIIPNSIGGNLKSNSLLCKKCNEHIGETYDAELSKMFSFVANQLGIKRDRGKSPRIKLVGNKSGEEILLEYNKPLLSKTKVERNGNEYTITAPNRAEARRHLKGLKRKHPEIDIDGVMESTKLQRTYTQEVYGVSTTYGGPNFSMAVVKIALNFCIYSGISKDYLRSTIDLFQNKTQTEIDLRSVNFYYPDVECVSKGDNEVLHSIIVVGDNKEGVLYAYIELFNFIQEIVLLNDSYAGADVKYAYHFDVISRNEVDKTSMLLLTRPEIENLLSTDVSLHSKNFERLKEKYIYLMNFASEKQRKDTTKEILEKTYQSFMSEMNLSDSDLISEEDLRKFCDKLALELTKHKLRIDDV